MVLSEESLKIKYRKEPFTTLNIEKGTLLTPSAKQFLADKNIEIFIGKSIDEVSNSKNIQGNISSDEVEMAIPFERPKYVGEKGEYYFEKPDYMTQVDGVLVFKNSQRIAFRGKLESFLSEI